MLTEIVVLIESGTTPEIVKGTIIAVQTAPNFITDHALLMI